MASQDESPLRDLVRVWPAITALMVVVSGLIVTWPRLDSSRPTALPSAAARVAADRTAPARLWQDPLATVPRGLPEESGQKLDEAFACLMKEMPHSHDLQQPPSIQFLLIYIDPQDSPESAELRRRERYSILSALSTAGYAPTQADRISYLPLRREGKDHPAPSCSVPTPNTSTPGLAIPYEWLRPLEKSARLAGEPAPCHYKVACVLWLSEDYDRAGRLASLICLKKALEQVAKPHDIHFSIAGQFGSAQVAALIREDEILGTRCAKPLQDITLYVTNATAPFARTMDLHANSGLALEFIIGSDQLLANALLAELRNRDVFPERGDKVAIVAEWDTKYGRSMHPVFENAALGEGTANYPAHHVHHYSYLRGLDGKLPGQSESKAEKDGKSSDAGGRREPSPGAVPTSKDAEGDSQVDYLRRLVERMRTDHDSFQAIGVVGSDVYDKILLLKALRLQYPQALFFTTDLDARLLQPGDYADTRNLLIASHFGLFLKDNLQGKIAPFRSSYGTASYLGVLRAVDFPPLHYLVETRPEPGQGRSLVPRGMQESPVQLYEVSRSGAYPLTLHDAKTDPLHPANPRSRPWITKGLRPYALAGALLLVLVLLWPVSAPCRRFLQSCQALGAYALARLSRPAESVPYPQTVTRFQITALISAVAGLILVGLIGAAHVKEGQEPFEILEGMSVWPTVLLRVVACVLCDCYIVTGLEDLRARNDRIRQSYFPDVESAGPVAGSPAPRPWYQRLQGIVQESWQMWTWNPTDPQVQTVWQESVRHGKERHRYWRCLLLSAAYFLLFCLLWKLFDHTMPQARGPIAWWTNCVILLLTGAMLVGLLVFVIDSTLLCYRLVSYLSGSAVEWPEDLVVRRAEERGLPLNTTSPAVADDLVREAVGQWLLIGLIDESTHVVSRLIYYPFVVLLVLIVAQNRLFDDWHWNYPLIIIGLLSAGTALVCALMLQRVAKRAKEKSLKVLATAVLPWVGSTYQEELRVKLERLREDIEGMSSSAFASFSQNPIVGALLLPLGGGGGLAVLEALRSSL